jgi:hypothetical protein
MKNIKKIAEEIIETLPDAITVKKALDGAFNSTYFLNLGNQNIGRAESWRARYGKFQVSDIKLKGEFITFYHGDAKLKSTKEKIVYDVVWELYADNKIYCAAFKEGAKQLFMNRLFSFVYSIDSKQMRGLKFF